MVLVQKVLVCLAASLACNTLVLPAKAQNVLSYVAQDEMAEWVDSVMSTLTPEERLGQLIIPIVSNQNNQETRDIILRDIKTYHVGGLLFSKGTIDDQAKLTEFAQSRSNVPLMITMDGEWGLNMRLPDAIRFPKNMALGCINHEINAQGSTLRDSLMYDYGYAVGEECRAIGVSVNFAPVLDINSNPNNPVIGNRSFGDTPNSVISAGLSYAAGLEDAGVLAVGKHFPGHGDTDKDSHKTLPVLQHDKNRMMTFETRPFAEFSKAGFGGMMVAHLEIPSLEKTKGMPSSASKNIITGILRNQLKFNGLVFTDGLAMEGAKKYPKMVIKALNAGVDILLDPVPIATQWEVLKKGLADGSLYQEEIDKKCRRVLAFKYALSCWQRPNTSNVNATKTQELSQRLYQSCLVLLKHEESFTDNKVIEVTSAKSTYAEQIRQTVKQTEDPFTLVFYTSPYNLKYYKEEIEKASSVILAHEDYKAAHDAVLNVLDDKADISGQLCVNIPGLYEEGEGIILPCSKSIEESHEVDYSPIPEVENQALAEIDTLVNDGLTKEAFPGCQVLVAHNGEIIYNKAFGWIDYSHKKRVLTNSLYDLASVTKAVATLPALMLLVDKKGIKVSDKLEKYIPELKGTDKKHLTIKQALFHETGLREGYPFYGLTIDSASVNGKLYSSKRDETYSVQQDAGTWFNHNLAWNPRWISPVRDKNHSFQIADSLYIDATFRDSILSTIIDIPLKNVGKYKYSCLNFVLLRFLIENASHQTLDVFLKENLYDVLGLENCCFKPRENDNIELSSIVPTEDDQALRRQVLRGYVHDEIAAWSGGVEGNAGLFSNATDLAKILQLFLDNGRYNGQQVISEKTCELFTTTQSPNSRRGLGFDKPNVKDLSKSPCADETPAVTYGHTGYTGTCFWVDPSNNLIYIFLCNRVNPHRWNNKLTSEGYRTRIQSAIYKALETAQ